MKYIYRIGGVMVSLFVLSVVDPPLFSLLYGVCLAERESKHQLPGLWFDPTTIYPRTRGEQANHYTTDA
jgi:hypothetical protein